MRTFRPTPARLFALNALAAAALAAHGQTAGTKPPSTELQTVEITAERTVENQKSVPVSATLLRPEQLEAMMTSGQDIRVLAAKVPSLNIGVVQRPHLSAAVHPGLWQHRLLHLRLAARVADL